MRNSRKVAQLPWGSELWDKLSWFSVITWWRVAVFRRCDLRPLLTSTAALLAPVPWMMVRRPNIKMSAYLMSPWTLAWVWKASVTLRQLWTGSQELIRIQSATLEQAWDCLAQRIEMQRGYRTRHYDVYLPPPDTHEIRPILFLPGAGVAHTAYSEVASLLSDQGYLVVVVNSGPQRIVDRWMRPFRVRVLRKLQTTIEKRHNITGEWILAGHSMGALTCTVLADPLGIRDIIMWAVPPFIEWQADLSNSSQEKNVLVVQGGNDWVVETFSTPENTQIFWDRLPMARRHVIPNGTHSGFASYVPGWKPEVEGIPRDQHHREAIKVTVDFLNKR